MRRHRLRISLTVLATVLCLGFPFTPTDPAVPDPYDIPPVDDAGELQDLARWLAAGQGTGDQRFHFILPGDFSAAMAPRPRQISLFRAGPDREARRRFLSRLPYGTAISLAAQRHRVDGLLVAAIVAVESSFTPDAVSPKGAKGLMQVRPAVGEAYGARDLFDPYANVDVGSRYFGSLLAEYGGNLELTLAAYNAGPAAVARYGGVPPYRETREYLRKVLARYADYNQRAREVAGSPLTGASRIRSGG